MVALFVNVFSGLGGISFGSQISTTASSFSSGGVGALFLWVPNHVLMDVPGGSSLKLTR